MAISRSLVPLPDVLADDLRKALIEYWNGIEVGSLEGVLGGLGRETEIKVTELLQSGLACDVDEASRLTARFECSRRNGS